MGLIQKEKRFYSKVDLVDIRIVLIKGKESRKKNKGGDLCGVAVDICILFAHKFNGIAMTLQVNKRK